MGLQDKGVREEESGHVGPDRISSGFGLWPKTAGNTEEVLTAK